MSEESVKTLESRPTLILLCSINNKIFIHMNINKEDNKEEKLINNKSDSKVFNNYSSNIYDVNAATKSLNTTLIMKLIDESINTTKCFEKSTLNLLKCREVSDKSKDSDAQSSENDDAELLRWVKGQNLTHDQILYLGSFIENSNLTTKELY